MFSKKQKNYQYRIPEKSPKKDFSEVLGKWDTGSKQNHFYIISWKKLLMAAK